MGHFCLLDPYFESGSSNLIESGSGSETLPPRACILRWLMAILAQVGYITEDDVKLLAKPERAIVDKIIDQGPCPAGQLNQKDVLSLYLQAHCCGTVTVGTVTFFRVEPEP